MKIGDFGGCRACSEEARRFLEGQIDNFRRLRNGDWKDEAKGDGGGDGCDGGDEMEEGAVGEEAEEERVEGTAAYLPPEVIRGERPSYAADVWSWGCLLFFCLAGKPPLIDLDHELTMKRVIAFAKDEADFYGKDRDNFSAGCRSLISLCCHKDAGQRPGLEVRSGKLRIQYTNVGKLASLSANDDTPFCNITTTLDARRRRSRPTAGSRRRTCGACTRAMRQSSTLAR